MIVPSIDLMGGKAVQLVGGKDLALNAGDPRPIAERFALAGEVAVIDLDAALGRGGNEEILRDLVQRFPCRVGGGIRSVEAAVRWLDAGASRIILGTAATPDILQQLPRERLIAAVDAVDGEVVVEGWQTGTGRPILDVLASLRPFVSGFLVTFVEREGRMSGTNLDAVREIVDQAGECRVTIAGGVHTADEIAELDRLGADAQVGMALYTGRIHLGDAIAAPLVTDRPDGLWPTVVTDERGVALGLAYSSRESLCRAVDTRRGVYHSRKRGVWVKGETSGAGQELLRIDADCDRDCLRFTVRQSEPGFCHTESRTCWGPDRGLGALARKLLHRASSAPSGSYTRRLFDDPALLRAKLIEEAGELSEASDPSHVVEEAADLLYFALVALARNKCDLAAAEAILDRRALRITRRPGHAKIVREEVV